MTADPDTYKKLKEMPAGANSIEWPIEQTRAAEAAARIFWPLGNTKLERRLPLIKAPTLILWGEKDRLMPRSYAAAIAKAIKAGPRSGHRRRRAISPSSTSPTRSPPRSLASWADDYLLVTSAMTMGRVASAFVGACARAGVQRTCVNVHPARTALQSVRRLPVILRLRLDVEAQLTRGARYSPCRDSRAYRNEPLSCGAKTPNQELPRIRTQDSGGLTGVQASRMVVRSGAAWGLPTMPDES